MSSFVKLSSFLPLLSHNVIGKIGSRISMIGGEEEENVSIEENIPGQKIQAYYHEN